MRKPLLHTKVTVKLRKSEYREEWYLVVESYPIRKPDGGKPGRIIESVNRIITTPIWDTTAITGIDADGNLSTSQSVIPMVLSCVRLALTGKHASMQIKCVHCVSKSMILLWYIQIESRK